MPRFKVAGCSHDTYPSHQLLFSHSTFSSSSLPRDASILTNYYVSYYTHSLYTYDAAKSAISYFRVDKSSSPSLFTLLFPNVYCFVTNSVCNQSLARHMQSCWSWIQWRLIVMTFILVLLCTCNTSWIKARDILTTSQSGTYTCIYTRYPRHWSNYPHIMWIT